MGSLSYDCPHCLTRKSHFQTLAANREDDEASVWSLYGYCASCRRGVVFHLFTMPGGRAQDPVKFDNSAFLASTGAFSIWATSPKSPEAFAIAALPEGVAASFNEAEQCLAAKTFSSAAVMYRKAVERSVRILDPNGQGLLNQRIRALEAAKGLPQGLIQLMDLVKFIGNDGAHDDIDPTQAEVEAGRDFTRLFLTYVWELPDRITKALAERAAKP